VRYSLPFTYFLFYQFSVINRSYCLIVLLMWALAALFRQKDEKPFRFSAVLILLGGVSVHGILLGGGFALAWCIDTVRSRVREGGGWSRRLLSDRRIHALLLYAAAIALYAFILWPPADRYTYGLVLDYGGFRFLYAFLLAPLDSVFTDVAVQYALGTPWYTGLYPAIVCVLSLAAFFVYLWRRRLFSYGFLSYLPLTLLLGLVYFSLYHEGLYVLWIITLVWIAKAGPYDPAPVRMPRRLRMVTRAALPIALTALFLMQFVYTAAISANEVKLPFESGRATARYLKEHNIDGRLVMNQYDMNREFGQVYTDQVVSALPYFDHNIFYNLNGGDPKKSYNTFRLPTGQEPAQIRGLPPADLLNQPISTHECKQRQRYNRRTAKAQNKGDNSSHLPKKHAGTPSADRKSIVFNFKTSLGHLVAAAPVADVLQKV
jgi:hypothetical protein